MFNASIVLYKHTVSEIEPLVRALLAAPNVATVCLLDNSPEENHSLKTLGAEYVFTGQNLGYGRAHNIAIRKSISQGVPYHLVVNPDIRFAAPGIMTELEDYMNENTDISHLMPKIVYPNGEIQYLCKQLPTPMDLIFRRFLPAGWTRRRMERFEMRDTGYDRVMDVPYLSGCFMFLRTKTLQQTGLFDERFFMYPEDIDLTRRIHAVSRTVFYPYVQVVHDHAQQSYKSARMLWVHMTNMARYFNKWGWLYDKERVKVNRAITRRRQTTNMNH